MKIIFIASILLLSYTLYSEENKPFKLPFPGLRLEVDATMMAEYDSADKTIGFYNTGLNLRAIHKSGLSINATTTVNGFIEEIDLLLSLISFFMKYI